MNTLTFANFVSKKISNSNRNSFSFLATRIGIIILSISIAFVIIFTLMLGGMSKTIGKKIFDFNGHIVMQNYSYYEELPISTNDFTIKLLRNDSFKVVHSFIQVLSIFQSKKNLGGVLCKGTDNIDILPIKNYIINGSFGALTEKEIIIGNKLAFNLGIEVGDKVLAFFLSDPPRYRNLIVKAIYKTNIPEIDERLVITNFELLQTIKNWGNDKVCGFEFLLKDYRNLDRAISSLYNSYGDKFRIINMRHKFSSIFDWLTILHQNKNILFTIIIIVICANIVSIILISLIERSYLVGVLKCLGARDKVINTIFFFNILNIVIKGIFIGNMLAVVVCILQHFFKFIKLDPDGIYMDYAIVDWDIISILSINLLFIFIISLTSIIFITIIGKIKPIKVINFD